MIRLFALALAAFAAAPALAEEAAMRQSIEAASLHEGPLDMVAYYLPAPDGALEVTATFAARSGGAPMRVVMALGDGDDVAFAMPGYPDALYRFARSAQVVAVSVRRIKSLEAAVAEPRLHGL
jgi:hypothetical protein